ncbi:hypothetical protein, partial [Acinetobacter baumannii]
GSDYDVCWVLCFCFMDYSWCKIGRSLRAGLVGFARTPSEKEDPSSLKSSFMQSLNLILILDSNPLFLRLYFAPYGQHP